METDGSGARLNRYTYGSWGEPGVSGWSGSRFRYTGQIMLPEAELYHYKARVYDPMYGRFMQTDPIGYADDLNLYAYVKNDPLSRIDPTGMMTVTLQLEGQLVVAAGGGVAGGLAVSFPTPSDPKAEFDLGYVGSASGLTGLLGGIGPSVSVSDGSIRDQDGVSNVDIIAVGIVSVEFEGRRSTNSAPGVSPSASVAEESNTRGEAGEKVTGKGGLKVGGATGTKISGSATIRDAAEAAANAADDFIKNQMKRTKICVPLICSP